MSKSKIYQSKDLISEIFEIMSNGVIIYETNDNGKNFRIKKINKAGLEICGVTKENVIGKSLTDIFPTLDKNNFIKTLKRVWKTDNPEHYPVYLYEDENANDLMELFFLKLPLEKIVVIIDTNTKKIEDEQNLKKKVEFEKTISIISSRFFILDNIDEAINASLKDIGILNRASRSYLFRFDEENNTMSNTHEWCSEDVESQKCQLQNIPIETFSWSIERIMKGEIINIEDVNNLPVEASMEKEEFIKERIKSLIFLPYKIGESISGFIGFDNVKKSRKWSEDNLNLLKISSNIIGNALNRKETEQKLENLTKELKSIVEERTKMLQESENVKTAILESLVEHIIYQSTDNTIIWANKAAADSVNLSTEQLIGRKCFEVWNAREEPCEECPIVKSLKTKKPETQEMVTPEGKIWYVKAHPIIDKKGNVSAIVESTLNITEEKTAKKKIKNSESKYKKAYYQANLYRDIFAHDFSNILQNISSSIELISLYLNNPEKIKALREIFGIVNEQVNRGKKLIKNVRKITEIDESEIILKKIDASFLLNNAIEFLHNSFQKRNINVQLNSTIKKLDVLANNLLLDVFENILINAVRYNDNSNIEIIINIENEEREGKKYLKMEFNDNGIGISDYRKKTIFERGSRKRYKSKGMGVGLSLVRKIVDSYNGDIWVEDRVKGDPKQGSNFIVLIPSNH